MKTRQKRLNTVYPDSFKTGGERPFDRTYSRLNREFSLPEKYGTSELVLMVADPSTLYVYWEIAEEVFRKIRKKTANEKIRSLKRILRVYSAREGSSAWVAKKKLDIKLKSPLSSRYISLPAGGKKWAVEIGLVSETGRFFRAIRSNEVKIPSRGICAFAEGSMNLISDKVCGKT